MRNYFALREILSLCRGLALILRPQYCELLLGRDNSRGRPIYPIKTRLNRSPHHSTGDCILERTACTTPFARGTKKEAESVKGELPPFRRGEVSADNRVPLLSRKSFLLPFLLLFFLLLPYICTIATLFIYVFFVT